MHLPLDCYTRLMHRGSVQTCDYIRTLADTVRMTIHQELIFTCQMALYVPHPSFKILASGRFRNSSRDVNIHQLKSPSSRFVVCWAYIDATRYVPNAGFSYYGAIRDYFLGSRLHLPDFRSFGESIIKKSLPAEQYRAMEGNLKRENEPEQILIINFK